MVDFDVETTGLQPWSGKNEAFLWIFTDGTEAEAIPFSPGGQDLKGWSEFAHNAIERIQHWFNRGKKEGIRAWNAKFDRGFAEAAGCFDVPGDGCWHDGMLVAHAVNEKRSVALKAVAQDLFGAEAADPQKLLKDWLNGENSRRSSLLKDAAKARVGKLRVKFVEATCLDKECKQKWTSPQGETLGDQCPSCGATGSTVKNRTRAATEEECSRIIAEASLYDAGEEGYVRANYSDVPTEIMEPYALEDVILTKKITDFYTATVLEQAPDLAGVYEFERDSLDSLYAIEKRGLPAREEEYRKLEQEVISNLEPLMDRCLELAAEGDPVIYAKALGKKVEVADDGRIISTQAGGSLSEFNPGSSQQVLAALKAREADMSYMSEKDGKISTDADNLRAVDDALAVAILELRSEQKVMSTYVRPMIGRSYVSAMNTYKEPFIAPDSRIHATYRQVGARTGRMSCADPNMQNQPRDDLRLRYNIVADPGHVLITCDLSNIEMMLFAAYCGEGKLLNTLREGGDLHVLTAEMLGLRDRARPGGGFETARQLGKVYNFTTIYGGGLRSIRRYFRCDMNQARIYKRRYADAYPEVSRLQTRIQYSLEDNGYVQDKLISGRRFRVDVRDSYKATNYLVQGTAASLLKKAVNSLHKEGVPMVALVHDEIVAHCPIDEAKETALLIEKHMVADAQPGGALWIPEENRPHVPLRADADIVTRWSDAKALEEKDADGKPTGRKYYFDPKWANVKRRYVDEQEPLV